MSFDNIKIRLVWPIELVNFVPCVLLFGFEIAVQDKIRFCQAQPQLQLKLSLLGWVSFNFAKSSTHPPPTQNSSEDTQYN